MKRSSRRKGFTLVELLIVIVVIGVLSAMMMLSSTEAVSSARASNIVSNLRNLKTAALAMYTDNLSSAGSMAAGTVETNGTTASGSFDKVLNYLSTGSNTDRTAYRNYGITKNTNGEWFVYCSVSDTNVQKKLTSRASSVGLLGNATAASMTSGGNPYNNEANVGMFVVKPD